jgi:hypothetical protein
MGYTLHFLITVRQLLIYQPTGRPVLGYLLSLIINQRYLSSPKNDCYE